MVNYLPLLAFFIFFPIFLFQTPPPTIDKASLNAPIDFTKITASLQKANVNWTPKVYSQFQQKTPNDLAKNFLGLIHPGDAQIKELRAKAPSTKPSALFFLLPTFFTATQKWPKCTSITTIRDQGNCGSCWAFASAEVMSDRECIRRGYNVILSAFQIASCVPSYCDGGWMGSAYDFYISNGVVHDYCQPYSLPLYCLRSSCKNTFYYYYWSLYFGYSKYALPYSEFSIMWDIYWNGPVTAAFYVYQDFYAYGGGVYYYKYGSFVGGHAIKIIGWGVENGIKYWLCANSWGTWWGLGGFFKIRRGTNECYIESWGVIAGFPKV